MAGVPIAVAFGGLTMTVSITPSGSLYTDANLTTAATFPVTTSTDTTWYASPSTGPYSVSIKFNGVELADPSGAAATVSATSGAAFTPAANLTSTRAEVADASAYPLRGRAAPGRPLRSWTTSTRRTTARSSMPRSSLRRSRPENCICGPKLEGDRWVHHALDGSDPAR